MNTENKDDVHYSEAFDTAKREALEIIRDLVKLITGVVSNVMYLIQELKELWEVLKELVRDYWPKKKKSPIEDLEFSMN
jgi:hypothetical protein